MPPARVLPEVTPQNGHFWRGGARGELRFLRCARCGFYVHPPAPICPTCLGRDLRAEAVSGRASVVTFTINHQAWEGSGADADACAEPPYAIAIVEMVEQAGLRLLTNIVRCRPEEVRIGMAVRVVFEAHGDVHLPLFEPEREAEPAR